jgi:hypothetical protein
VRAPRSGLTAVRVSGHWPAVGATVAIDFPGQMRRSSGHTLIGMTAAAAISPRRHGGLADGSAGVFHRRPLHPVLSGHALEVTDSNVPRIGQSKWAAGGHRDLCLADSQSVELAQCSTDCARRLGRSRFSSDEPHRSEAAWHGSWHEMTSTAVGWWGWWDGSEDTVAGRGHSCRDPASF